ncbi:MAG: hypothetical protein ACE5H3_00625, partial [Planctomycetota bacterium]
ILPPKDWVTSWSDAVRRTRSAASGVPVSLDLGDGNLYPMEGYRSDPPYWWTLVDLGSKGRPGMHLFLFHALKEKQAPNTSELVRFSWELMRTSKESALPPPGRPPR